MTRHQERNFGWWVVGQLAVGAAGLKILPSVLPHHGLPVVYLALTAMLLALIAFTRWLPEGNSARSSSGPNTAGPGAPLNVDWGWSAAALLAVVAFYVAVGGSWTYVERMGDRAGIPATRVADALTIASLFGIAGSLSATWLGPRLGRRIPLAFGYALLAGGIAALSWPLTEALFRGANYAFKYAWTFVLPYMLACITALDPSGRLIVLTNLCIGTGLAFGPAVAALTLARAPDYSGVIALGVAGSALSFALIFTLALRLAREPRS